jgi:hypothetical protein
MVMYRIKIEDFTLILSLIIILTISQPYSLPPVPVGCKGDNSPLTWRGGEVRGNMDRGGKGSFYYSHLDNFLSDSICLQGK